MPIDLKFLVRATALCACVGAPWLAQAQTQSPPPVEVKAAPAPSTAMSAMKAQGAGHFVCGGIGLDESTAMRAAMKDHPLSLLFARADGEYMADVNVKITGAKGASALAVRAAGPVCLIDLPAGGYIVEATSGGVSKREAVTLGTSPKTVDFRF